ncbi:hypothetical protein HMPREF0591_0881 [Mycobacterium parascrofulaceum ATCC BAA-614]|jgi:hypothetical protein|uniref:Uncharacterized protein n=1 Tax=Mycobacterium parascrofulaceum ATCC BAA-614 TaxID=525368 RepID=D5P3Y7_9MYCO|nr:MULTISPECIES: hypothetical protein [Mycobacterium]EFG79176.1 hypothetical protein HMPREF0591_0881 [Mycobacterium parascrofulaceum ATCC BAA-614]
MEFGSLSLEIPATRDAEREDEVRSLGQAVDEGNVARMQGMR